jgi:hypothetical protein
VTAMPVSVQGSLSAEIYQPAGRDARISLAIFFDAILPLRRPKLAKPKYDRSAPDDEIPF